MVSTSDIALPGATLAVRASRGAGLRARPAPVDSASPVAVSGAALGLTLVLAPLVLTLVAGGGTAQRAGLALLLLQTLYVYCVSTCLGTTPVGRLRCMHIAPVLIVPSLVAIASGLVLGAAPRSLLLAQPAIAGVALLGWGIGRVGRRLRADPAGSAALGWLLAACAAISVLPVSHLAEFLVSTPRLGEVVLAANPFVAVTGAAGYDLLRTETLYRALTLSSYRFRYPDPVTAFAVPATLGLVLVAAFARRGAAARPGNRRCRNEEAAA